MPHISFRVSEQERELMEGYASLRGLNLSDAIREAFFERLEEEFDLKLIREFEAESPSELLSHEEVGKLLKIQ